MFLPKATARFRGHAPGARQRGRRRVRSCDANVRSFTSRRAPEPAAPPRLWPWLLGRGLSWPRHCSCGSARGGAGGRAARIVAAVLIGLWAFVAGTARHVLTLSVDRDRSRVRARQRESAAVQSALAGSGGVAIRVTLARSLEPLDRTIGDRPRGARDSFALVAHVVRLSAQDNLAVIGLALPPALAIAWVARRRRPVSSRA